jgi:hypothetical protein
MADQEINPILGEAYYIVITDISKERVQQDEQWGGPEHDDQHTLDDWERFIILQLNLMQLSVPTGRTPRDRLVKVAALAVAAIESLDRQAAKEPDHAG